MPRKYIRTSALIISLSSLCGASSTSASYLCDVTLQMDTQEPLRTISVTIDYSNIEGEFIVAESGKDSAKRSALGLVCSTDVPKTNLLVHDSCNRSDAECQLGEARSLLVQATNRYGLRGRREMKEYLGHADLVTCKFRTEEKIDKSQFRLKVASAMTISGEHYLRNSPLVMLNPIDCRREGDTASYAQ